MNNTEKELLFSELKSKYDQLAALVISIQTDENVLASGAVTTVSRQQQLDNLATKYAELSTLVNAIQVQENQLVNAINPPIPSPVPSPVPNPNPNPNPNPIPQPKKSLIVTLISWLASFNPITDVVFKLIMVVGMGFLTAQQGCNLNPFPPPGPSPPPPNPGPNPGPNPSPVSQKLYAIQVFNANASDAATQSAMVIGGDPNINAQLLTLNVEWRHWDSQEPLIDRLNLRHYLPDPAALPVLLIYDDKNQFYDLNGKKLPRDKPVFQLPPKTSDAMISAFKNIRK